MASPMLPQDLPAESKFAWTLPEVMAILEANPNDTYMQHVALQIACRSGRLREVAQTIESLKGMSNRRQTRPEPPSILALFSGALAVKESLQLDALQREDGPPPAARDKSTYRHVSELRRIDLPGHPWTQMHAGKQPQVSRLAGMVPAEFLFMKARSLKAVFEAIETLSHWAASASLQMSRQSVESRLAEKLEMELALEKNHTDRLNELVEEVALTSSDLFASEGSDITVLLNARNSKETAGEIDKLILQAQSNHSASLQSGKFNCVSYRQFFSPDQKVNAFFAESAAGVHVISNSLPAFERTIQMVMKSSQIWWNCTCFQRINCLPGWRQIRNCRSR